MRTSARFNPVRPIAVALAVVIAALCPPFAALAQTPPRPMPAAAAPEARVHAEAEKRGQGGGCADALGELPDDVDFVLVINNASQLRKSFLGEALGQLLAESEALPLTGKSWTQLAQKVGWAEQEAFDNLLGERVVLIGKEMSDPDKRRWVILSDVSERTRQQLSKSLAVAPRALYKGSQILTIEDGKLELTAVPRRAAEPAGTHGVKPVGSRDRRGKQAAAGGALGDGRSLRLILGPADRSELFNRMIDRMVDAPAVGARGTLGGTDVPKTAHSLGRASILLLTRPPEIAMKVAVPGGIAAAANNPARTWDRFLVIAANAVDAGGTAWSTRIVYRDPARAESLVKVPVTSDAQFRALEDRSLLAVLQVLPVKRVLGPEFRLGDMLGWFRATLPEEAHALMSARQVLRLRQVEPAVPEPKLVGMVVADAIPKTAPQEAIQSGMFGPKARLACSIAFETQDPTTLARVLDGSIAGVIQAAEQRGGGGQLQPHDFAGLAPAAARVVPLQFGDVNNYRAAFGAPLAVAWAYPSPDPASHPAARVENPPAAWWVALVTPSGLFDPDPSPAQLLAEDSAALLTPDNGGDARRWLWMGSCRPAAVERLLPLVLPDLFLGMRTIMRRLEHAAGSLSITDDGLIRGEINVELSADSVKPANADAPTGSPRGR